MKHRTLISCALAVAIGSTGLAQSQLQEGRIELQGTVTYLYSSVSEPYSSTRGYKPEYSLQTIAISPSVGYFLSKPLQVFFQPRLGMTRSSSMMPSGFMDPSGERQVVSTEYSSGISIGLAYHLVEAGVVVPFFGVATEVRWTRRTVQMGLAGFPDQKTDWSIPEVVVPNITIGVKTFFLQDWSLITQLQISSIQRPNGIAGAEGMRASFGFGIAAYL